MSVQDLARSLTAVGSAKLPSEEGQGLYLLSVRDGNLVEKFWVGHTLQNETVIASDARDDTSASYLLGLEDEPRRVVYIDQENSVQCYAYDEIEEWEEDPRGSNWNITTSPQSKLSANYGQKGEIVVSYQNEDGQLAGITSMSEDDWEVFGPLGGNPLSGTPQCLDIISEKLHLFYIEEDGSIKYLVLDSDTGDWQAHELMTAAFDTPIQNFSIAYDQDSGSFQSYFLTGGSLWSVDGKKEKVFLGKVQADGKLIPSSAAQAGWFIRWRRLRRVRKVMERNGVVYYVVVHHVALPPQKRVARAYHSPA